MTPNTLIIRTAGTNCDQELGEAFELAGSTTRTVHLNQIIADPGLIDQFDLIGFPGGFSYGDDISAGRILANRVRHHLLGPLQDAVKRGTPIIGICNGFQVLVQAGLLPDPDDLNLPGFRRGVTLTDNGSGRFIDRWVSLRVPPDTKCIWTKGMDRLELPIAHGEGRFWTESDSHIDRLRQGKQIAVRYDHDDNPNGSVDDIAGICDPSGVVLGLMPHPERFIHRTHHPQWTRPRPRPRVRSDPQQSIPEDSRGLTGDDLPDGLRLFRNAVAYACDVSCV